MNSTSLSLDSKVLYGLQIHFYLIIMFVIDLQNWYIKLYFCFKFKCHWQIQNNSVQVLLCHPRIYNRILVANL